MQRLRMPLRSKCTAMSCSTGSVLVHFRGHPLKVVNCISAPIRNQNSLSSSYQNFTICPSIVRKRAFHSTWGRFEQGDKKETIFSTTLRFTLTGIGLFILFIAYVFCYHWYKTLKLKWDVGRLAKSPSNLKNLTAKGLQLASEYLRLKSVRKRFDEFDVDLPDNTVLKYRPSQFYCGKPSVDGSITSLPIRMEMYEESYMLPTVAYVIIPEEDNGQYRFVEKVRITFQRSIITLLVPLTVVNHVPPRKQDPSQFSLHIRMTTGLTDQYYVSHVSIIQQTETYQNVSFLA